MNTKSIEHFIREFTNKLGLDLTRYRPDASEAGRLAAMLSHHKVDIVLDIGANVGQFAWALRRAGYCGNIVSFEPLSDAHAALLEASRRDALWEIAPRTAIGENEGEIEIHISGNSVSSSILGMLDSHVSAAPTSNYVGTETAPICTIDSITGTYCPAEKCVFMKIDSQGYEPQILDGASELLQKALGVQMELSLVPLYEDQQLSDVLIERMHALGFTTWAIWPALFDPETGRMLQADITFFRM
jgi:FkbM family methyltransferase